MSFARSFFHECRPLFRALEGHHHSRIARRSSWPYPAISTLNSDGPFHLLWGWGNSGWNGRFFGGDRTLSLDLADKGDAFAIEADLPGVKKEDLSVRIADNGQSLVIEGSVGKKKTGDNVQTATGDSSSATEHSSRLLSERTAEFSRKIWLPQPVDATSVKAKLEDGVLKLHIPKAQEDGSHRVDVA